MDESRASSPRDDIFQGAERYDRSIDWAARIGREVPVLSNVFGPPDEGGLIDAGCGTGRQTCALAERGYHVVGADASEEMIDLARRMARQTARRGPGSVEFVVAPYAELSAALGGGHDGVYCVGNALAAAGTKDGVAEAIRQFAQCLRPGGRMFAQVLNFGPMRDQVPCVRGPRLAVVDGREYISVRHFSFVEDHVDVTNITLWYDDGWHKDTHGGRLHPVSLDELRTFCAASGVRIDEVWGSYSREPFDPVASNDLLIAASRV